MGEFMKKQVKWDGVGRAIGSDRSERAAHTRCGVRCIYLPTTGGCGQAKNAIFSEMPAALGKRDAWSEKGLEIQGLQTEIGLESRCMAGLAAGPNGAGGPSGDG